MTETAPYGCWTSPITAADVARGEALLDWVDFVGDEVWWIEARPEDGGRNVLVRHGTGTPAADVLAAPWSVRSKVIEYGGRPWLPLGSSPADGFVFTNWADQRVYRCTPGGAPEPISPAPTPPAGLHYCDFTLVGEEVWCLRETALDQAATSVRRHLVALPLNGAAAGDASLVRELAASHHLMTGPKVSPDGGHVAWLGWDHPTMPWQTTDLMCAAVLPGGRLGTPFRVAGDPRVSIGQVEWAPDEPETLYVLSDPGGWWNIHRVGLDGSARNLCARDEEFGEPLWRIGARWFVPAGGGRLFVTHGTSQRSLAVLSGGELRDISGPYTEWAAIASDGKHVAATAASPRHERAVVRVDPDTGEITVLRGGDPPHRDYLPAPSHHRFTGDDGQPVHAFVYPPHNPDYAAPDGELPPFVVFAHGGPTSRGKMVVNLEIAYFTSRGIGVVDVQYGGSTGFGRAYRERLDGTWGVVDVQDCATAARGLVAAGIADPHRIGIRGGSAGGWTAAASLGTEPDLYRVAAIYFPVLDAVEWRRMGTHDFESRYLDTLLGPWPEAEHRYREQAPIHHVDKIRAPFVLLQGLDDNICPPAQAQRLLDQLRDGQVEYEYLTFAGERHGFRKAETMIACLEAELSHYAKAFGLSG